MKNGKMPISRYNPSYEARIEEHDQKLKAEAKEAEYVAKKASIFGNNETKELKRTVGNDDKHEILVGKSKDGKKVRVDANTLEELVAVDTAGKNKYITKSEFDEMVRQVLHVKQLPEGMTAEFQHGSLVFKRGGDILTANDIRKDKDLIAQREKEQKEARRLEKEKAIAELSKGIPSLLQAPILDPGKIELKGLELAQSTSPTPQGAESGDAPLAKPPKVKTVEGQVQEIVIKPEKKQQPYKLAIPKGMTKEQAIQRFGLHEITKGQFYSPGEAGVVSDSIYVWSDKENAFINKKAKGLDKAHIVVPQGMKSSIEEADKKEQDKKAYDAAHTSGRNLMRGLIDGDKKNFDKAIQGLKPQYIKGFLRGTKAAVGRTEGTGDIFARMNMAGLTPEQKRNATLKIFTCLSKWGDAKRASFVQYINGRKHTHTFQSVIQDLKNGKQVSSEVIQKLMKQINL